MLDSVKQRLDLLLVERGLADSRQKAQALILGGEVLIGEAIASKPGTRVSVDSPITLRQKPPFVGRGGIKLAHALDRFHIDVDGLVALDVGASTGGFTDCLLQRGASRVYAIDVGYGQLDYRLRTDPRVVVMERVNARHPLSLPQAADLASFDLSFISLQKVVANVASSLKRGGQLVCLVKPQFEAGRKQVSKGGLVKDPAIHADVLGRFLCWALDSGFRLGGLTPSPILGASGNREFFVLLRSD